MLLALMGASSAAVAAAGEEPRVAITQGVLEGRETDGVRRFLNIPYAEGPVGALRWKAPRPAPGWQGVRMATQMGPICAQWRPPTDTRPMSEDCLSLNIWAPDSAGKALPVMVWIHGGGFIGGSNSQPAYDGAVLAGKQVVVVTVNYRLGPLGFMAHPGLTAEAPYGASGNYGILDLVEALNWVRGNIAAFGGDPDNVTLFGQSAGSTAISILQASPLAKGLFHRAIAQSTSQFDPDGGLIGRQDMRGAEQYGQAFGRKLGAETIEALRALPAEALTGELTFFWPTERDGYVLPDLVYTVFEDGRQHDVPLLLGSTADEGATIRKEWVYRTPEQAAAYDRLYGTLADPVRQSATDAIQWQMRTWARLQGRTGRHPAWLYFFDQPWPGQPELGAFHSSDVEFTFGMLDVRDQPWREADRRLSTLMMDYWVRFARHGDPNGPSLPAWPAYDDAAPRLMRLSSAPALIATPRAEAQVFLDRWFDERR